MVGGTDSDKRQAWNTIMGRKRPHQVAQLNAVALVEAMGTSSSSSNNDQDTDTQTSSSD